MTFLNYFIEPWTIWGLEAPRFSWLAAVGLLIFPLVALLKLWWVSRRERRSLEGLTLRVEKLRTRHPVDPQKGLSPNAYKDLSDIFLKSESLRSAWSAYASLVVSRRPGTGEEQFWASESADSVFSDAAIIEPRINRSFFASLPGIVTGTGLLFTFMAILVALLKVHFNKDTQQILGLDLLIQGLSGKFVSSIAALFAATIFLLFEKPINYKLSTARMRLSSSIDEFVPRLSMTRVLAEIQRDAAEQSVALRSFNADLSGKLKQGFSESLGPMIQRMARGIDELNQQLRAAEAAKQESISGSVSTLLQSLEESLQSSIQSMGETFREPASGRTAGELTKATESLGGAARLLENLNAQAQNTQSALTELVNLARKSTAEQSALGKSQIEELTAVLRQFLVQMSETAGVSVNDMAATLTAVVQGLSIKLNDLGAQLTATLQRSAEQTTSAAAAVVDRADKWSSRSAEQLRQVIEQLAGSVKSSKEVENALVAAFGLFRKSLEQYASLNAGLDRIAGEVNAMAASAAGAAHSTSESQEVLQQVAAHTSTQMERLADANRRQAEVWSGMQSGLDSYKNAFMHTERAARELLAQIAQQVDSHLQVTRLGYSEIIRIADGHFAHATQKLGTSIDELDERLKDLAETFEMLRGKNDGLRQ